MYYLLSGRHVPALIPPSEDEADRFIGSPKLPPRPLGEITHGLPSRLVRLVMRCCNRDPAMRPASARQVAGVLKMIQASFAEAPV